MRPAQNARDNLQQPEAWMQADQASMRPAQNARDNRAACVKCVVGCKLQ